MTLAKARKRFDWRLVRLLVIGGLIGLVIGAVGAVIDSREHPARPQANVTSSGVL